MIQQCCMNNIFANFKGLSAIGIAILLVSACSSGTVIRPGDTVDVAFEKAMELYENERYGSASDAFETVLSIGRGTEYARNAQYYLAKSYFNNNQFRIAANEFQRYASTYPRSERGVEAQFMEAKSYYNLSPRFQLDQTDTHRAIERFQLFIERHSNHELRADAVEKLDELRTKLAKKKYHAGLFYMQIDYYEAAAIYFEETIDSYPETKWAEQALVDQIRAYVYYAENSIEERQEERFEKAVESYERYLQIFPRGENRERAERYHERAMNGISEVEGLASS